VPGFSFVQGNNESGHVRVPGEEIQKVVLQLLQDKSRPDVWVFPMLYPRVQVVTRLLRALVSELTASEGESDKLSETEEMRLGI
jgi:hypothetical protein